MSLLLTVACGRLERCDVESLKRQHGRDVKMPDLLLWRIIRRRAPYNGIGVPSFILSGAPFSHHKPSFLRFHRTGYDFRKSDRPRYRRRGGPGRLFCSNRSRWMAVGSEPQPLLILRASGGPSLGRQRLRKPFGLAVERASGEQIRSMRVGPTCGRRSPVSIGKI